MGERGEAIISSAYRQVVFDSRADGRVDEGLIQVHHQSKLPGLQ